MNNSRFLILVLISFLSFQNCTQTDKIVVPEEVGLSSDSLNLANQTLQQYIDDGKLAGIFTMVLKDGKIVQRERFGFANIENQEVVEEDAIFRIFSMSKPITTVALMTLFDEGKFELDDKVSDFIPEFEGTMVYNTEGEIPSLEPQKNEMTIRHLLTHTSGITYGWDPNSYVDSLYRATDVTGWDSATIGDKVKVLAELPLKFQPGTKWEYGLSIDVAGYLVEVLSGIPLDEYFKKSIFDPLNMVDTDFYVPEEKHDRLAELYNFDKDGNLVAAGSFGDRFKEPAMVFSGGGGLVSTMDDYATFCKMLLNGGELNGKRILEESTVELIMTDQLPEGSSYWGNNGYGLGGAVNFETSEYSWAGAASTSFWIDPQNDMIILAFTQFMPSDYTYSNEFNDIVRSGLLE